MLLHIHTTTDTNLKKLIPTMEFMESNLQYISTEKTLQSIQTEAMAFPHVILLKFSLTFHLVIKHPTITEDKIEKQTEVQHPFSTIFYNSPLLSFILFFCSIRFFFILLGFTFSCLIGTYLSFGCLVSALIVPGLYKT